MKKVSSLRKKLHVKKGDSVKIIAGQEKGKIGSIQSINYLTSKVVVKGINLRVKHVKPKGVGENGQVVRLEFPIHSSNVSKYQEEVK